ncbi:MAG: NAD(P)/FAD-dependent oxidoreductase [Candidatus Bathycorpusculaceae bacterium]
MENHADVIIVGGGPCGSFAALNLAKLGAKEVTVLEEHSEIGVPCHCAGHLSIKSLKRLGLYPLPEKIVENILYGAVVYSPSGKSFSVRFSSPVTCAVNRVFFDKYVAYLAETAGVRYYLDSRVESLIVENDFVKGVNVKQNGRFEKKYSSKVVVDAEGAFSRILRQTGLSAFNRNMLVYGVQAEIEGAKDVESDVVEIYLGNRYAPGFFAWLIPKRNGTAKVGLAAKTGNPKRLLEKLMFKHPAASKKLRAAKIFRMTFHPLTLGGPIEKAYSNGFLAVGDAASQVKPTTGGGVIFGLTCARVAAEIVYEALQKGDFSAQFLSCYQKRFIEILGFDFSVMLWIRRLLNRLSDKQLDDIISFCTSFNLEKAVGSFGDIDFQGQALLKSLKDPRLFLAAAYFLYLSLSANP